MMTIITSIVTTITAAQAEALGGLAVGLLVLLLILREVLVAYAANPASKHTSRGRLATSYASVVRLAIVPLLFVFGLVIVAHIFPGF
jgi:hypothetical protein